MKLKYFSTGDL